MERIIFIVLFIGAESQLPNPQFLLPPKPDKCNRPPEFLYRQCCVFPPFFTREAAKNCGAFFELVSHDKAKNLTAFRRHPTSTCEHWKCMLTKYALLSPEGNLDDDKYFRHLERWSTLNPSFSETIKKAKSHCKIGYQRFLPMEVCEFYNLHSCVRNFVNVNCPVIFPTKECEELRMFYDECKDYYT